MSNKILYLNIQNLQQEIASIIQSKGLDISDCESKTLQDNSKWIRIFHHAHKSGTVFFSDYLEALSCSNPDKFSKLYLLDHLKGNDDKYEFMLEYPVEFPNQIIRWKQTNNPWRDYTGTNELTSATGYEAIQVDIVDSSGKGQGLVRHNEKMNSNDPCLLKGCPGHSSWFYAIGAKQAWNEGIPGPDGVVVSVIDLWVRIDNTYFNDYDIVTINANDFIKKVDIKKIQNVVRILETNFTNNCCQSVNTLTCQSIGCESCQDSCTQCSSKCQGCQNTCTCQSNKQCKQCNACNCMNKCTMLDRARGNTCSNGCTCQSCQIRDCNCDCNCDG